jgi:hypothetical protein
MAKGKYYTPEFKEQAVKMVVGLDCTYDLLHASRTCATTCTRPTSATYIWRLTDFRILDPAGYYLRITDRFQ